MHIIWIYRILYQIYVNRITDWEIKKYEDPNSVHTGVSAQGLETEQSEVLQVWYANASESHSRNQSAGSSPEHAILINILVLPSLRGPP